MKAYPIRRPGKRTAAQGIWLQRMSAAMIFPHSLLRLIYTRKQRNFLKKQMPLPRFFRMIRPPFHLTGMRARKWIQNLMIRLQKKWLWQKMRLIRKPCMQVKHRRSSLSVSPLYRLPKQTTICSEHIYMRQRFRRILQRRCPVLQKNTDTAKKRRPLRPRYLQIFAI